MAKHAWPRYRTKTLKAVQGSEIKSKMAIEEISHVSRHATDCNLTHRNIPFFYKIAERIRS